MLAACHAAVMFVASAGVNRLKLQSTVLPQLLSCGGFENAAPRWEAIKRHFGEAFTFESVGLTSSLVSFAMDTAAFDALYQVYLKEPIEREWESRLDRHFYMASHRGGCCVTDYEYQCLKSSAPRERTTDPPRLH